MKTFYEQTILDSIDLEGYEVTQDSLLNQVYNIFKSEYGWNINRIGERKAFSEWLSGLPSVLTVPFYYNEMIQNAINGGLDIKDEVEFCANYFDRLTEAFFNLKDNL